MMFKLDLRRAASEKNAHPYNIALWERQQAARCELYSIERIGVMLPTCFLTVKFFVIRGGRASLAFMGATKRNSMASVCARRTA